MSMDHDYSISPYVATEGGFQVPTILDTIAKKTVQTHYMIAFGVIVLMALVLIWLLVWKGKETFNPTQNLRDQDSDQFGLSGRERMEDPRAASAFAQQVQSGGGGSFAYNPNSAAPAVNSLSYQVLHSSDFACDTRTTVGDDAWAWMNGVAASESMRGDKPKNDNDFSRVLSGR